MYGGIFRLGVEWFCMAVDMGPNRRKYVAEVRLVGKDEVELL